MSVTIVKLRDEHKNMGSLLTILRREIEHFKNGGPADFHLVRDILDYNVNFPDACHHPKEDLIFQTLGKRDADAASAVGDLEREHADLYVLAKRFATAVDNILGNSTLPRDWFAEVAEDYLRAMRRHMQMEEVVFFPAAERILSDEDWAAIDARVFDKVDPLFDKTIEGRYENLRRAIESSETVAEAS